MFNIFIILLVFFSGQTKSFDFNKHKKGAYVPGEVIVKFKDTVSPEAQTKFLTDTETFFDIKRNFKTKKSLVLQFNDAKTNVIEFINEHKSNSDIEYIEPNYKVWISEVPNTGDKYGYQWGLKNTGQTLMEIDGETSPAGSVGIQGTIGKDINIEPLWQKKGADCSSTKIAIIDTGLNPYVADFIANSISYYNAITQQACDDGTCTLDLNGHGTHVAGIIAGDGDTDINGVCSKAELLIIKAMDDTGEGSMDIISNAIIYAADNGVKVANLSLGGWTPVVPNILAYAVKYAKNMGMMLIVAAGNDGYSSDNGMDPPVLKSFKELYNKLL